MLWTECLLNAKPIESMYSIPPPLDRIRLLEVRLHQDGPRVSLRVDLNVFPDNPPRKWSMSKYNRAQLTLVLIAVDEVRIKGWNIDNIGDLKLIREGGGVKMTFVGDSTEIECRTQFVDIDSLSAYCDSESAMP